MNGSVSDWVLENKGTAKTMSSCLGVLIRVGFLCVFPLSGRRNSFLTLEHEDNSQGWLLSCTPLEPRELYWHVPAPQPLPCQFTLPPPASSQPKLTTAPATDTALPCLAPGVWGALSLPTVLIANTAYLWGLPSSFSEWAVDLLQV